MPGRNAGRTYSPLGLEVASVASLVWSWTATTLALGTTAPVAS